VSNYKNIRTSEDQILIECGDATQFKRVLTSFIEPNAIFGEKISRLNKYQLILENIEYESVNECLSFFRGSGMTGSYLIEWGSLDYEEVSCLRGKVNRNLEA
jgi:hypothetical protein